MSIKAIAPVIGTILLTVYAQIVIKWQVLKAGSIPFSLEEKAYYLIKIFVNPWVISGFIAIFVGSICWLFAMSKLQLSYIYPFIGLTIVLVVFASAVLFKESLSFSQIAGSILVVLGLLVICYSHSST